MRAWDHGHASEKWAQKDRRPGFCAEEEGRRPRCRRPTGLRGRGDLSAALTTSLSHPSCRGRRVLSLPGRGTRCVIKQRTKQTLWSVPLNVSPRRAWVWGGLRTPGAAELRTRPVSAQLRSRVTPWRRRGSDASGSSSSSPMWRKRSAPTPMGPRVSAGPWGDGGGGGAVGPSQPAVSHPPPRQVGSQKARDQSPGARAVCSL